MEMSLYCGKNGHIKPFCYKLYGYPKKKPEAKAHHVKTKPRKEWKPKNVVSNPMSFPTKVVVNSTIGSPKETLPESDVVTDVSIFVAQPGQYVETIQENPHIEYEYESTSEDEKCQSKVTDHGEEEKTVGDKNKICASVGNEKFASDGKDQR
ncbi:hypothetical protein QL285_069725 [Trifolium repens]|nr:hypothetical protein QL285_069725 [Trifolium repens]